jgi:hypothetical protein
MPEYITAEYNTAGDGARLGMLLHDDAQPISEEDRNDNAIFALLQPRQPIRVTPQMGTRRSGWLG